MASLPTDLKDTLAFFSDPKLKLGIEASTTLEPIVDREKRTGPLAAFEEPKVNDGATVPSLGVVVLLAKDDIMVGVGGSESGTEAEETGNVNPEPLSGGNAHLPFGFVIEIEVKGGLFPEGGWGFGIWSTSEQAALRTTSGMPFSSF